MTFWRSAHDCKEKGKWVEERSDGIETKSWEGNEVEIVLLIFFSCSTPNFSSSLPGYICFHMYSVFICD